MRFSLGASGRSIGGMARTKISVTLEPEIAAEARTRAEAYGGMSGLVNAALNSYLQRLRLWEWARQMEEEHGPLSEEGWEAGERMFLEADEWPASKRQRSA
jgi:hypothetical protein